MYVTSRAPSCPSSYGSWIYNYLCNQCLSTLMLWGRISIRARCTTLCDKVCQWRSTSLGFSPRPPVSFTNKTEILLKVALSTIKPRKNKKKPSHLCKFKWMQPLRFVIISVTITLSMSIVSDYCNMIYKYINET